MSFLLSLAYLVVEYMRPQMMYEFLWGLPLAQIVIVLLLFFFLLERESFSNSNPQNPLLFVYLCAFFISTVFALSPGLAWSAFVDLLKWVLIYFVLINVLNERKRVYIFVVLLLLLNFKYSQFAVRVWAENGFYSDPRGLYAGAGIGSSFFKNPNDFGAAMNSIFGLGFYMLVSDPGRVLSGIKMRWFYLAATASFIIAILSTSSRGAALALGAVAVAIVIKKKSFTTIAAIIAAFLVFIYLIPDDNWSRFKSIGTNDDSTGIERLELWKAGIRMANDHPFTGVGPNNFVHANLDVYRNGLGFAQHNIFVQVASELGYTGLVIFLAMLATFFKMQRTVRRTLRKKNIDDPLLYGLSHGLDISLIGFVINGFFITVLYYPFFWVLLILNASLFDLAMRLKPGTAAAPDLMGR